MNDQHDLEIMVVSRFPIILIETHEELRSLDLLERVEFLGSLGYGNTWQGVSFHLALYAAKTSHLKLLSS